MELPEPIRGLVGLGESGLAHHELLDRIELRLLELGGRAQPTGEVLEDFPVEHLFTPGLYVRTIRMPAGSVLTSKVHLTEHPFAVLQGRCFVLQEDGGWQKVEAPHLGVTQPGTRRLLVVLEETIWSTFHPTDSTDLLEIEQEILADYVNPLIGGPE